MSRGNRVIQVMFCLGTPFLLAACSGNRPAVLPVPLKGMPPEVLLRERPIPLPAGVALPGEVVFPPGGEMENRSAAAKSLPQ